MLFELPSSKPLEEIERALREAAARHGFGVLTVHNLRETMRKKGVDYDGECMIYEVCSPQHAKRALEANPAVSTALPCRISVYRNVDSYRLATILPTEMMRMFGTPALHPVAAEVEREVRAIMREAA